MEATRNTPVKNKRLARIIARETTNRTGIKHRAMILDDGWKIITKKRRI